MNKSLQMSTLLNTIYNDAYRCKAKKKNVQFCFIQITLLVFNFTLNLTNIKTIQRRKIKNTSIFFNNFLQFNVNKCLLSISSDLSTEQIYTM